MILNFTSDDRCKKYTTLELLVSMAVKLNNVLLNLITGCIYWLTTCFGQLHDHHHPVIRFSKTLLYLTAILTNSNHQHNGMEGTKLL